MTSVIIKQIQNGMICTHWILCTNILFHSNCCQFLSGLLITSCQFPQKIYLNIPLKPSSSSGFDCDISWYNGTSESCGCMHWWVAHQDQREALQASDWDWRVLESTHDIPTYKTVIIIVITSVFGTLSGNGFTCFAGNFSLCCGLDCAKCKHFVKTHIYHA